MINNILSIASGALINAQAAISVHSDNVANVSTEGYTRRTVNYETRDSIYRNGLSLGTGAVIDSVQRHVDMFLEAQYLEGNAGYSMWEARTDTLYAVETLFSEDGDYGLSSALSQFWASLNDLSEYPDDVASKEAVLTYAQTLSSGLNSLSSSLDGEILSLNETIASQVDDANDLIESIAAINADIAASPDDLTLQDERDRMIRELSSIVDVYTIENDNGTYSVLTREGQTLVDGVEHYSLSYEGPQTDTILSEGSTFDGQVYFDGEHNGELLIEFISTGPTDGSASAATFRVSLDGGATWVEGDDGAPAEFTAGGIDDAVTVEGVSIWFGTSSDSATLPTNNAQAGDRFEIMPKSGVYWVKTTSSSVNITPLGSVSNSDTRLSGGSLAGLLTARDSILEYAKEVDALAEEIVWQVNLAHSQGASVDPLGYASSGMSVDDSTIPLAETDLAFADRLAQGNLSFALYDSDTGEALGVTALDFSSVTPGVASFDPTVHSLDDVAQAINDTLAGEITASVSNGTLILDAGAGYSFSFAGDSTGLLAAMEINTLFSGDNAGNMDVSAALLADANKLCAGAVDATGVVENGDNTIAAKLVDLQYADVKLSALVNSGSQTLDEHWSTIVASVGLDVDEAARNATLSGTLVESIDERCEEVSGVNLDEELTLLTRYQQAYEAAAQLIQTANEMFDIVMSLKS